MAFDTPELNESEIQNSNELAITRAEKPSREWARSNPDAALAYLFVAKADEDDLIEEILAA